MKKLHLLFLLIVLFFTVSAVQAQEENPSPDNDAVNQNQNVPRRPNLLAELNLSPEQIGQIRQINADNKNLRREAQEKLREANRRLDQAVYAENADENEVQARIKDVHAAQLEVLKLRTQAEFAVRKILTPEQLTRFREIRRQFNEQKQNSPEMRKNRRLNFPNRRLNNRQRRGNAPN